MYKTILVIIFKLIRFFLVLSFAVMLASCASTKNTTVINTNQFLQTNYDFNCLDGTKTFTQIIICYQKQDAAEKAQNKITNDLLNTNQK